MAIVLNGKNSIRLQLFPLFEYDLIQPHQDETIQTNQMGNDCLKLALGKNDFSSSISNLFSKLLIYTQAMIWIS
jgi:hypothetical protein